MDTPPAEGLTVSVDAAITLRNTHPNQIALL
jgi:hypothetical protein